MTPPLSQMENRWSCYSLGLHYYSQLLLFLHTQLLFSIILCKTAFTSINECQWWIIRDDVIHVSIVRLIGTFSSCEWFLSNNQLLQSCQMIQFEFDDFLKAVVLNNNLLQPIIVDKFILRLFAPTSRSRSQTCNVLVRTILISSLLRTIEKPWNFTYDSYYSLYRSYCLSSSFVKLLTIASFLLHILLSFATCRCKCTQILCIHSSLLSIPALSPSCFCFQMWHNRFGIWIVSSIVLIPLWIIHTILPLSKLFSMIVQIDSNLIEGLFPFHLSYSLIKTHLLF